MVSFSMACSLHFQHASRHLARTFCLPSRFSPSLRNALMTSHPSTAYQSDLLVQQRCISSISTGKSKIFSCPEMVEVTCLRFYSKGKERGKEKKKGPVTIDESEMAELINIHRLKDEFQKGIDQLKADFVKNLTIRSPFGVIENLEVQLDGETYTLQEIAQLGKKGSQLIVINLSSTPQAIKPVLKAINDTGMGLNPQQDGTSVFITIPKVTREYRESLAKSAKVYFQKFKDHSRDIQNRYIREVKKKEKEVSSDLAFSVQQQIHALEEQYVKEAEKIMVAKQNELLGNKE